MLRGEKELRWACEAIWTVAIALTLFCVIYIPSQVVLNFIFITLLGK